MDSLLHSLSFVINPFILMHCDSGYERHRVSAVISASATVFFPRMNHCFKEKLGDLGYFATWCPPAPAEGFFVGLRPIFMHAVLMIHDQHVTSLSFLTGSYFTDSSFSLPCS